MGGLLGNDEPAPKLLARIGEIFTPELFTRRKAPTKSLGSTAWLDGLRGVAALFVSFSHLTAYSFDGLEMCYGAKFLHNDDHNVSPAALPILRLPFSGGGFAVMLFFVISGYVVPRRLLQNLQEGQRQDFLTNLHSAMVRRPVRLWLPVILSTFVVGASWHILGIPGPAFGSKANVFLEFWSWLQETSNFVYFFKIGWLFNYYNVHTWTIPVELRGSMFMFTYLLLVQNVRNRTRILMTVGMVLHLSMASSGAWYACFFGGMLICDLELLAAAGKSVPLPWDGIDKWLRSNSVVRSVLLHLLFVASLHLATEPTAEYMTRQEALGSCPGWGTLSRLIPGAYWDADSYFRWYWLFWGAFLMVLVIKEISWLRSIFETRTAQYLGRHSFALYLVHGPLITTFSVYPLYMTGIKHVWSEDEVAQFGGIQDLLRNQPWWPLPDGGPAGLQPNYLFCAAVSIPFFLYCAEVGTKVFDIPSNKASRWVWQKWQTL